MAQRCTKHLKTTSKTRPHYPHSLNSSSTSSSPLLTSKGTFDAKKNWVSELTLARVAFLTKMYGSGASPTTLPSTESEAHHPEVNTVKGALLFVVANDVIKSEFKRDALSEIWSKWAGRAGRIEQALENGVWNPSTSGLCKFCPVKTCAYN